MLQPFDEAPGPVTIASPQRGGAPLWMLGLLGVQFLLGMGVNFYVALPSGGMTEMMNSGPSPLLVVHMMLGMALGAGALLTLWFARQHGRRPIVCAVVALGGVVGAGISGMVFVTGGHSDVASFLMSGGFLVAVAGYVAELVTIADAVAPREHAGRQRTKATG